MKVKDLMNLNNENMPKSLGNIIETLKQWSFFIDKCYKYIQQMVNLLKFHRGDETFDHVRNALFNENNVLNLYDSDSGKIKESTFNFQQLFLYILTESQYLTQINFTQKQENEVMNSTEFLDPIFAASILNDQTSIALKRIVDAVTKESDSLNTTFMIIMIFVVVL
jgi:hypothetical protein